MVTTGQVTLDILQKHFESQSKHVPSEENTSFPTEEQVNVLWKLSDKCRMSITSLLQIARMLMIEKCVV
jgi:hypothetical protein